MFNHFAVSQHLSISASFFTALKSASLVCLCILDSLKAPGRAVVSAPPHVHNECEFATTSSAPPPIMAGPSPCTPPPSWAPLCSIQSVTFEVFFLPEVY